jgi:hypothetical protein
MEVEQALALFIDPLLAAVLAHKTSQCYRFTLLMCCRSMHSYNGKGCRR